LIKPVPVRNLRLVKTEEGWKRVEIKEEVKEEEAEVRLFSRSPTPEPEPPIQNQNYPSTGPYYRERSLTYFDDEGREHWKNGSDDPNDWTFPTIYWDFFWNN
jgi:hypothetical protein